MRVVYKCLVSTFLAYLRMWRPLKGNNIKTQNEHKMAMHMFLPKKRELFLHSYVPKQVFPLIFKGTKY